MIKAILARRSNKQRLSATAPVYLFQYITPAMTATIIAVSTIVVMNFEQLKVNFNTNVPLNGLIIGILCISICGAIANNLRLYHTAKFMQRINHMVDDGNVTPEKVLHLKRLLNTRAFTMNTANMQNGINNLEKYHRLNLNDTDARLIKSKVGFRVRLGRGSVGFLAGILVMLGLLGTFWGLLKTIDAVGEAMGAMSNIGGGEDGEVDMSGFISSIAAPLQGMGLAFSSSLFGLSGSLLIGFFNFLCGSSQNTFIEKMSLWVDSHLATFSPKKQAEGKKQEAVADKDEIKNMLAGVTYLNNKVNLQLAELLPTLQQAATAMSETSQTVNQLKDSQEQSAGNIENIAQSCNKMAGETAQIVTSLQQDITPLSQQISDQITNQIAPSLQENIQIAKSELAPQLQQTSDILTKELAPQAKAFQQESIAMQKEQLSHLQTQNNQLTGAQQEQQANWQAYLSLYQDKHQEHVTSCQNIEQRLSELQHLVKDYDQNQQNLQQSNTNTLQTQTAEIIELAKENVKAANDQHAQLISLNTQSNEAKSQDKAQFEQLRNALEQMINQQEGLKTESKKLRLLLEQEPDHAYHTKMVEQIENIISEVSSKVINTNDKKRFAFWKKKNDE